VVVDPPDGGVTLVKRVLALPGETIELRQGHVLIQGEMLDEPWQVNYGGGDYPAINIPNGHVFILGDNRPVSHDSRAIGPVPFESILGAVSFVYWPLDHLGLAP